MIPGALIVVEGIDGSGKTTIVDLLVEWLMNQLRESPYAVIKTKEPGSPLITLCRDIRNMLFNSTYKHNLDAVEQGLLFFIDHYHHAKQVKTWVDQGNFVVSDRWAYTQYAYADVKREPNVDADILYHKYEPLQIQPNIVFFLDIDPEVAKTRSRTRTNKKESQEDKQWGTRDDLHVKTREGYQRLMKLYGSWINIPVSPSMDQYEVLHQIIPHLTTLL